VGLFCFFKFACFLNIDVTIELEAIKRRPVLNFRQPSVDVVELDPGAQVVEIDGGARVQELESQVH